MKVIDKIEEFSNLPTKVFGNHHLKSHILHGIDVMSNQHIVRTLGQGCIQIDVPIYTTDIKHGLEGTWKKAVCFLKSLVIPERDDIATIPRISFQLFENLVNDVMLLNNSPVTLTDCPCIFHFPVIPVVNIVLVIENF